MHYVATSCYSILMISRSVQRIVQEWCWIFCAARKNAATTSRFKTGPISCRASCVPTKTARESLRPVALCKTRREFLFPSMPASYGGSKTEMPAHRCLREFPRARHPVPMPCKWLLMSMDAAYTIYLAQKNTSKKSQRKQHIQATWVISAFERSQYCFRSFPTWPPLSLDV